MKTWEEIKIEIASPELTHLVITEEVYKEIQRDACESALREAAGKVAIVELVSGVAGPCLSINNTRVAGPKPWGGGVVIHKWEVNASRLLEILALIGKDEQ